jgi:fucose 4-O-acetylase-like acetyltransferase
MKHVRLRRGCVDDVFVSDDDMPRARQLRHVQIHNLHAIPLLLLYISINRAIIRTCVCIYYNRQRRVVNAQDVVPDEDAYTNLITTVMMMVEVTYTEYIRNTAKYTTAVLERGEQVVVRLGKRTFVIMADHTMTLIKTALDVAASAIDETPESFSVIDSA